MRRTIAILSSTLSLLGAAALASAQPRKAPELVGMKPVKTIKPTRGFIDDPFVFDGAGGRLLYVNADTGYLAELRMLDLTQDAAELAKVDISKFTTAPVSVRLLEKDFFVVGRPSKAEKARAAVIDSAGKVERTFGPADDIVLTSVNDELVVAMYSIAEKKAKGKSTFHHTVELVSLDGKKRHGKPRTLIADEKGYIPKLDFRINHWANGYTRVIGIKGGTWDAKENQRSPDHEAWYDMITGVFSKRIDITDVMQHTHLMREWANHRNETQFLAVSSDLKRLESISPDSRQTIELAQPFQHYDPGSLEYQPTDDGLFFFTLKIDPVNPEAAARKQADPEYLDLYEYRAGEKKAVRRARILLTTKRKMSWRATTEHWVLVPRLVGFDRGGKELQIFKLEK